MRDVVVFGSSNILSDLADCAHASGLRISRVVVDEEPAPGPRDVPLAVRVRSFERLGMAVCIERIDGFEPRAGELYVIGPTTPQRFALVERLQQRLGLRFHTLVHPRACVSPLAEMAEGCFVGAGSVLAPGVRLAAHVFVNRGVTIGHDTAVESYARLQPGANVGGLTRVGRGSTVGLGATVLERLVIGSETVVAAGAVVTSDLPDRVLAAGVPAVVKCALPPIFDA
jgi:sugar O-acyltransferase (sialic acid O-acetyltransferase NeuD family)